MFSSLVRGRELAAFIQEQTKSDACRVNLIPSVASEAKFNPLLPTLATIVSGWREVLCLLDLGHRAETAIALIPDLVAELLATALTRNGQALRGDRN